MYHLFVSGNEASWMGSPWVIEADRCLNSGEYTDDQLVSRFGSLGLEAVEELLQIPCVLAFETSCKLAAKLGRLTKIRRKDGKVRVEYELDKDYPPILHNDLISLEWELGIGKLELNRTHWALKNESLTEALSRLGYPPIGLPAMPVVDIFSHTFDVALSFPGEVRNYVQLVATNLVTSLGRDRVFYDNFFKSQLARPNLDVALQTIYRDRALLIVVFLSRDYSTKKWCHIEFRAIRDIINSREDARVMFVRHDGAEVAGVFSADGYIDATQHDPNDVARLIRERVSLIRQK